LLNFQYKKGLVWRYRPASSLVVSLGKAYNGIASTVPLSGYTGTVVTGGSLTRKPKWSLCCFLVEVPWQIN